jgi:hypothetical protein
VTREEWDEFQARGVAEMNVDTDIEILQTLQAAKGQPVTRFTREQRQAMYDEALPWAREHVKKMRAKGYVPVLEAYCSGNASTHE